MPAKGKRKIPDKTKAEIVIAKELKPSGTATNSQLAVAFDVAENTVAKAKYEALSDQQKAIYAQIVEDLKHDALGLTSATMRKSQELVALADKPSHLPGVVAAGKFAHDVYRLETGQSTQNVALSPSDTAKQYFDYLLRQGIDRQAAIMKLRGATALDVDGEVLNDVADELEKG